MWTARLVLAPQGICSFVCVHVVGATFGGIREARGLLPFWPSSSPRLLNFASSFCSPASPYSCEAFNSFVQAHRLERSRNDQRSTRSSDSGSISGAIYISSLCLASWRGCGGRQGSEEARSSREAAQRDLLDRGAGSERAGRPQVRSLRRRGDAEIASSGCGPWASVGRSIPRE